MGIKISELANEIEKCLDEYSIEVTKALEDTKIDLAKTAVTELKATSPRSNTKRSGTYAKGWKRTKRGKVYIVHNKEYQLTHLLEKGHAKVNGGRVPAQKHIEPVEHELQNTAEDVFKNKLK